MTQGDNGWATVRDYLPEGSRAIGFWANDEYVFVVCLEGRRHREDELQSELDLYACSTTHIKVSSPSVETARGFLADALWRASIERHATGISIGVQADEAAQGIEDFDSEYADDDGDADSDVIRMCAYCGREIISDEDVALLDELTGEPRLEWDTDVMEVHVDCLSNRGPTVGKSG